MKIILIKDCPQGKKDQVIEVADGYAKNFLIKQGFAVAINKVTTHQQHANLASRAAEEARLLKNAQKIKALIDNLELSFKLKTTNNVVHGSVTRKQIHQALLAQGLRIDMHNIANTHINSLGTSWVLIKLHPQVEVKLKIKVSEDGK